MTPQSSALAVVSSVRRENDNIASLSRRSRDGRCPLISARNLTCLFAIALCGCGNGVNGDASALVGLWTLDAQSPGEGTRTIVLQLPTTDPTSGTRGLITGSPTPGAEIYCPITLTNETDNAVAFINGPDCVYSTAGSQNSPQTAAGTVTLMMNRIVLSLTLTSDSHVVTQVDASAPHN